MNLIKAIYAVLLFGLFSFPLGCQINTAKESAQTEELDNHKFLSISRFVDGDTFWLDDGSEKGLKVRLIGINAPEPRSYFNMKEEPFGKEASEHIKELIGNNKVRVELDLQITDQYDRVLVYAFTESGVFINEQMVLDGFARVATYPPNINYQNLFIVAEQKARANKAGLWSD